jgi:hypothetical protein
LIFVFSIKPPVTMATMQITDINNILLSRTWLVFDEIA